MASTVVLEIDAPRYIRFGGPTDERGYFQYEFAEVADGTRMRFVQHFPAGGVYTETLDELGGDLPGGSGTPWKPASLADGTSSGTRSQTISTASPWGRACRRLNLVRSLRPG